MEKHHHPHHHHTPLHQEEEAPQSNKFFDPDHQEHPWNWPYWHWIDIGSHITAHRLDMAYKAAQAVEEATGVASKALPFLEAAARVTPIIGVIGEGIHASYPAYYAWEDYNAHKISTSKFASLEAMYALYTVSGVGGFVTMGVKEVATYETLDHRWMGKLADKVPAVRDFIKRRPALDNIIYSKSWLEERYVPHSLWRELIHTGTADWALDRVDDVENSTQDAIDAAQNAWDAYRQQHDHAGTPHQHHGDGPCAICAAWLGELHPAAPHATPSPAGKAHKH